MSKRAVLSNLTRKYFHDNNDTEVALTGITGTETASLFNYNHLINIVKGFCFVTIIFTALFGNALVLIAVLRYERLRQVRTNSFLVSLALADFLVALLVMPFNAAMSLMNGHWIFGKLYCDIFNANDVLFSTASILHLCCISTERYIAIISPLTYEYKMTHRRITFMLSVTWMLSILISYVPIMCGIHTTAEYSNRSSGSEPLYECEFVVNPYYAVLSSCTSFWIPSLVMIAIYLRIFIEARHQETKIRKLDILLKIPQVQTTTENCTSEQEQRLNTDTSGRTMTRPSGSVSSLGSNMLCTTTQNGQEIVKNTTQEMKIRRENKAAKTLGIVMGAFLLCWFPFFLWYTSTNLCGGSAHCPYPPVIGEILYWIGYLNSTLNPIIYAYYNRAFRSAFKRTLQCFRQHDQLSQVGETSRSPNLRRSISPYQTACTTG